MKGLPNCNVISCIIFNKSLTIICTAKIASPPVFCTQRGTALYLLSHRMTISTNIPVHLFRPVFTLQGYIPSQCGPDLSFSRWWRCSKSRRSFPVYLATAVHKRSNGPVPGQKLATKVSKSRAIPPYVPVVNPPGWPLKSA